MAAFIESPVTRQARPSEEPIDVTVHVFACRIREHAIQAYCDHFLNIEPGPKQGYVFQAARGFGGLMTLECRPMPLGVAPSPPEFIDPPHRVGGPNVIKFTVAIPVWRYACGPSNVLTDPQICWIQPILVFNNSTLVFQARETTGFDAFHGAIWVGANTEATFSAAPGQDTTPPPLADSLAAEVLLSTIVDYSPISPKKMAPFMHVTTGATAPDMPAIHEDEHNLEETTKKLLRAFPYFQSMLRDRNYVMDVVTLKQYRGFPNIRDALYKSLSSQIYEYDDVRNVRFYDPKDIDIKFYPTDMTSQIFHDYLDLPARSVIYGQHTPDRIERDLGAEFSVPPPLVADHEPYQSPTPIAFRFEATLLPRKMRTLYTFA